MNPIIIGNGKNTNKIIVLQICFKTLKYFYTFKKKGWLITFLHFLH